jgi:hypothetical protein
VSLTQIKSSCLQETGTHHAVVAAAHQPGSVDDALTEIAREGARSQRYMRPTIHILEVTSNGKKDTGLTSAPSARLMRNHSHSASMS